MVMKRNYENFTEFGSSLCTELSRVLSDQERFSNFRLQRVPVDSNLRLRSENLEKTTTLEEHMNSVRNALNEIKVLIPKKLVEEVSDAANNRVYEFLTDEWSGNKDNSDTKFILKIEDIRSAICF